MKERAYILQTFYHKNMFKNTLNFKMNSIVKLFDIFEEKNSCPNCLAYFFFDHLKIFDHLAFDMLIFNLKCISYLINDLNYSPIRMYLFSK